MIARVDISENVFEGGDINTSVVKLDDICAMFIFYILEQCSYAIIQTKHKKKFSVKTTTRANTPRY